jgi:hypothetical protein
MLVPGGGEKKAIIAAIFPFCAEAPVSSFSS